MVGSEHRWVGEDGERKGSVRKGEKSERPSRSDGEAGGELRGARRWDPGLLPVTRGRALSPPAA